MTNKERIEMEANELFEYLWGLSKIKAREYIEMTSPIDYQSGYVDGYLHGVEVAIGKR